MLAYGSQDEKIKVPSHSLIFVSIQAKYRPSPSLLHLNIFLSECIVI
jgi:hypothetical protein